MILFQHRIERRMLKRDQMASCNTEPDFGVPGLVASFRLVCSFAIDRLVATLIWRTGEQR